MTSLNINANVLWVLLGSTLVVGCGDPIDLDVHRFACETTVDCAAGFTCEADPLSLGMVCLPVGATPATCDDGRQNGLEAGTDCGSICSVPCASGTIICASAADCESGICRDQTCIPAGCNDDVKNGTESDVDCGGSCDPCGDGGTCGSNADCDSALCTGGFCDNDSCFDNIQNANESDVDCGGRCNEDCADFKMCAKGQDCESRVCHPDEFVCVPASCDDGVRNAGETDIDCGGPCEPCE